MKVRCEDCFWNNKNTKDKKFIRCILYPKYQHIKIIEASHIKQCVSHLKKISTSSLAQEVRNKYDLNAGDIASKKYIKFQKEKAEVSFAELQGNPAREYYLSRIKDCKRFRKLFMGSNTFNNTHYNQIFEEANNVIKSIELYIFENELNNYLIMRSLVASAIYCSCKNLGHSVTTKEIMHLFKVGLDSIRKYIHFYSKSKNINIGNSNISNTKTERIELKVI